MKRYYIVFGALVLIIGVLAFWQPWVKPASVTSSPTETPVPTGTPTANITVTSPQNGASLGLPFLVQGEAREFENVVRVRVRTKEGTILFDTVTMAQSPDIGQFGPYVVEVSHLFVRPTTNDIFVEVFANSAKDGSEIDLVSIPAKLNLGQTSTVKVFFAKDDCNNVSPVERVTVKTQAVARAAIDALLIGPSPAERREGFTSLINTDTRLKSLAIDQNGLAKVDFSSELEAGVAGSCRVLGIRAQIEKTLKQFPTVKNVVISIDGRTEDILQP